MDKMVDYLSLDPKITLELAPLDGSSSAATRDDDPIRLLQALIQLLGQVFKYTAMPYAGPFPKIHGRKPQPKATHGVGLWLLTASGCCRPASSDSCPVPEEHMSE
jgi:hypothetical protein